MATVLSKSEPLAYRRQVDPTWTPAQRAVYLACHHAYDAWSEVEEACRHGAARLSDTSDLLHRHWKQAEEDAAKYFTSEED